MEADFQREYGINLVEALPAMSWRRFLSLVNGFGPNSVFVYLSDKDKEMPAGEWTDDSGPLGKIKALSKADLRNFKVVN